MTEFIPENQVEFAERIEVSLTGDCPTIADVRNIWGEKYASIWLANQINDLSEYTGVKNDLLQYQKKEAARVIMSEFYYLKLSEFMLFFFQFKAGRYGKFYGSVDPLVITEALQKFKKWRYDMLQQIERQDAMMKNNEKPLNDPNSLTYKEWQELKWLFNMGYERDSVTGKIK